MKITLLIIPAALLALASCSNREIRVEEKERTISVTGSADANLTPDEVTLTIQIGEYYTEQFMPGKTEKDYKTLVKLDEIEKPIMELLKKNGIADSCIHFNYMNTTWSWYYSEEKKPVRFEKTLGIKFHDFEKAVAMIQQLDTKGITYLTLGDFKSSKEQETRKDLKAQALKNAQEKAEFMLDNVDKKLGEIISVEEVDDNSTYTWGQSQTSFLSNSSYSESQAAPAASPQDIKMRYEVKASFLIE
jgi:uncharacterized protein YggE